jgi:hypothetical protein
LRPNPAEYVAVVGMERSRSLRFSGAGFLGLAEHDVTFADCDFRYISPVLVLENEK